MLCQTPPPPPSAPSSRLVARTLRPLVLPSQGEGGSAARHLLLARGLRVVRPHVERAPPPLPPLGRGGLWRAMRASSFAGHACEPAHLQLLGAITERAVCTRRLRQFGMLDAAGIEFARLHAHTTRPPDRAPERPTARPHDHPTGQPPPVRPLAHTAGLPTVRPARPPTRPPTPPDRSADRPTGPPVRCRPRRTRGSSLRFSSSRAAASG